MVEIDKLTGGLNKIEDWLERADRLSKDQNNYLIKMCYLHKANVEVRVLLYGILINY